MIWNHLNNSAVRDLAWAIFSEPLLISRQLDPELDNCTIALTPEREASLLALDAEPAPLLTHLHERSSTRLGIYFEYLWQFFLANDTELELVAHNLPVRDGGRTLGEYDLIYKQRDSDQHIHLELALKYYLGLPDSATWLGPGKQDRLADKMTHLLQRQTQLANTEPGRAVLSDLGVDKLLRQMEVKGYLFANAESNTAEPIGLNPDYALRKWLPYSAFQEKRDGEQRLGLERLQWLCPTRTGAAGDWLQQQIRARGQPAMLARMQNGEEVERCFVTPDHWPDEA